VKVIDEMVTAANAVSPALAPGHVRQMLEAATITSTVDELVASLRYLLKAQCEAKGYWAPGAEMARASLTKATGETFVG
jgi:hypothetical protein